MSKKIIPAVILQVLLCLLVAFTPSVKKKALAENGTDYSVRACEGWYYSYSDESFSDSVSVELELKSIDIPGGYSSYSADNENGFLYLSGEDKLSGHCTCRLNGTEAISGLNTILDGGIYDYSGDYSARFERFLRSHEVLVNFKVYKGDMLFHGITVDGIELTEYLAGISAEN